MIETIQLMCAFYFDNPTMKRLNKGHCLILHRMLFFYMDDIGNDGAINNISDFNPADDF